VKCLRIRELIDAAWLMIPRLDLLYKERDIVRSKYHAKHLQMTDDLFRAQATLERIPVQDAEIYYVRELPLAQSAEIVMKRLIDEVPWRAEDVALWGKTFAQPRLIAWYGDEGARYKYSGIVHDPLPWTDILRDIKNRIETVAGAHFNSVLLNYYRNERDSMGFHSDDEPELGRRPVIASLSLGEERTFILKHKTRRDLKSVGLKLASGSLLVMKGDTQHCWKHGIEKEKLPRGPRINLTFRRIYQIRARKNSCPPSAALKSE
jgi:alkylated DNA repair dioxygenase AlkB